MSNPASLRCISGPALSIFLQQLTLCKVEFINFVSLFTASPSGIWMEDRDNPRKEGKPGVPSFEGGSIVSGGGGPFHL
jgi:hypothetical protein